MRAKINAALKEAERGSDQRKVSVLRLILAAIKERDIAARALDRCQGACEDEIACILVTMIRQREDMARAYEESGRLDLADHERTEIGVIRGFLPPQLSDDEIECACDTVMSELKATGLRDMGRCMCTLKERYAGRMDFSKACSIVKARLSQPPSLPLVSHG